eukprot:1148455-Pelagomonas_calceolata.AAC.1
MLACASWHAPVLSKRLRQFFSIACHASLTCLLPHARQPYSHSAPYALKLNIQVLENHNRAAKS